VSGNVSEWGFGWVKVGGKMCRQVGLGGWVGGMVYGWVGVSGIVSE
jgi:hypothetical protein